MAGAAGADATTPCDLGRRETLVAPAARDDHQQFAVDAPLESTIIGFVDTTLSQNAIVAAEPLGRGTVFVGAVRRRPACRRCDVACLPETAMLVSMAQVDRVDGTSSGA